MLTRTFVSVKITIIVPGTPHLLSAELGRMNAPRLLRDMHGDFDALVRVGGVFHTSGRATVREYAPYHGAGILLWQDEDNYIRLEIARMSSMARLAHTSTLNTARMVSWPLQEVRRSGTAPAISG